MAGGSNQERERDRGGAQGAERRGPLDGSTSGTIGGGGRETGGPTVRPSPPETPAAKPDDAASGRLAPDPLDATAQPDELLSGPTDVNRR